MEAEVGQLTDGRCLLSLNLLQVEQKNQNKIVKIIFRSHSLAVAPLSDVDA